jgi:hypothetical protein
VAQDRDGALFNVTAAKPNPGGKSGYPSPYRVGDDTHV